MVAVKYVGRSSASSLTLSRIAFAEPPRPEVCASIVPSSLRGCSFSSLAALLLSSASFSSAFAFDSVPVRGFATFGAAFLPPELVVVFAPFVTCAC